MRHAYLSLDVLAARLSLPQWFLEEEARQGRIPCLRVGERVRFDEDAVAAALRRQSNRAGPRHADDGDPNAAFKEPKGAGHA